jgi:hypothetical protein
LTKTPLENNRQRQRFFRECETLFDQLNIDRGTIESRECRLIDENRR